MTYSTPELRKLGSLTELTLGVGSRNGDAGSKFTPGTGNGNGNGNGGPKTVVGGIAG